MTDKIKLLNKIRHSRKNVRANELRKLMKDFGFEPKKTKHTTLYTHTICMAIRPVSVVEHKESGQENKIFECYVKNCLKAIDELLLIEKGERE